MRDGLFLKTKVLQVLLPARSRKEEQQDDWTKIKNRTSPGASAPGKYPVNIYLFICIIILSCVLVFYMNKSVQCYKSWFIVFCDVVNEHTRLIVSRSREKTEYLKFQYCYGLGALLHCVCIIAHFFSRRYFRNIGIVLRHDQAAQTVNMAHTKCFLCL